MEQYGGCYRNAVRSDKEIYCELIECLEKQGEFESDIHRVHTEIEAINNRLKYLGECEAEKVTSS